MPAPIKHLKHLLGEKRNSDDIALFARWPMDMLYYQCVLKELFPTQKMAIVCFFDGTQFEVHVSELHLQYLKELDQVYDNQLDDIICCICENGKADKDNDILICDVCQQSYHQKCHDPKIPNSVLYPENDDEDWSCGACEYIGRQCKKNKQQYTSSAIKSRKGGKRKAKDVDDDLEDKKAPRVKLPIRPIRATRAKAGSQGSESDSDHENRPANQDSSSEGGSLAEDLKKLTTKTGATVNKVPDKIEKISSLLMNRGAPPLIETPDMVNALTGENKALELEEEEQQRPKEAQRPQEIAKAPEKARRKLPKALKPVADKETSSVRTTPIAATIPVKAKKEQSPRKPSTSKAGLPRRIPKPPRKIGAAAPAS